MRSIRILALLLALAGPACGREDWRGLVQWSTTAGLSDTLAFSTLDEAYFRHDARDDYTYDAYFTLTRQMGGGVALFGQYLVAALEPENGSWATAEWADGGVSWTTDLPYVGRLRLQERVYARLDSPAGWDHHRPRVYLIRPFGDWTLTVSDEVRFDLSGDRAQDLFRNRVFVTAGWKATDLLSLGVGIFRNWDHEDDGHWSAWNGVQTVITVTL